jgi:hypothetical protein
MRVWYGRSGRGRALKWALWVASNSCGRFGQYRWRTRPGLEIAKMLRRRCCALRTELKPALGTARVRPQPTGDSLARRALICAVPPFLSARIATTPYSLLYRSAVVFLRGLQLRCSSAPLLSDSGSRRIGAPWGLLGLAKVLSVFRACRRSW